jgi:hypothetical protein
MALCLIYANRHSAEFLSFCFQQNRHLTWGLTHCFCGRGYYKGMLLVAGATYLSESPFLLLFIWKEIFWFLAAGWIVSLIVLIRAS